MHFLVFFVTVTDSFLYIYEVFSYNFSHYFWILFSKWLHGVVAITTEKRDSK